MKISVEHCGKTITIEVNDDDMTVSDFIESIIVPIMFNMGYHIDSIKNCLNTDYVDIMA